MDNNADLEELLDRWEEACELGTPISAEELCHSQLDLLEPLKAKIKAIEKINGCLGSGLSAPEPSPQPEARRRGNVSPVVVESKFVDLRFHDRGGLGIVYKARDHELHRDVAVKFLHQKISGSPQDRHRFHEEAEITGRLDHPGIVPVYAMGQTADGQPFYAMRFIRGETLDDMIKQYHVSKAAMTDSQQRVVMRKLLAHMVSVCRTIAYAHTRGIVHRDIKPKNVMCGKYAETLVVDWGLAAPFAREGLFRVEDEMTLVPKTSAALNLSREGGGTPVYMSPEQAAGRSEIGPATDIYCLGGLLYKAITGELAFDGESPIQIRTRIMKGDFVPPRKIDRQIPGPLESICLKAMSLLPTNRYETAAAMADDLENFLADAPVPNHQYSWLERCTRIIRRHQRRFVVLLISTTLLAACAMSAATVFFQMQRQAKRTLYAATASQRDALNLTCSMASRSIQYNLESRLIALENLATSLPLADHLEDGNVEQLQQMLFEHRDASERRLPSVSWFLLDRRGELISRAADSDAAAPDDFERWTRPYFHGHEGELDPLHDRRPPPLAQPSLSPVFYGKYEGRKLCSLSVPVRIKGDVTAVLVMTIQMGQFDPLIDQRPAETTVSDRFSSLVETRGALKGALLHHPGLTGLETQRAADCAVSDDRLNSLSQIDCNTTQPQQLLGYSDPVGGPYSGAWNTVALPVHIRSSNGDPVPCGWILLVQSRPLDVTSE